MSVRGAVGSRALPLSTWAGMTVVVLATSFVSNRVLRDPDWRTWRGAHILLDGVLQYDGHNYLTIAAEGYSYRAGTQSLIVWFPLYPLLIRAVDDLVHPVVAGVVVTAACSLVALLLYWEWLGRHRFTGAARAGAFLALALYPYSWFLYGVIYADATFLACALAAVLLVESHRPVLAGVAGALATAARPTGMALLPALWALDASRRGALGPWVAHTRDGLAGRVRRALARLADWVRWPGSFDRGGVVRALATPVLSLGGILAYAVYLGVRFGDPLIFLSNQEEFHGRWPYLKLTFASRMVRFAETPVLSSTLLLQLCFAVAMVATTGAVARRLGFPYAVLVLGAIGIPAIGTHDFMGTGRYLLLAFPVFAVVGERLATRPALARGVLAASAALMVTMAFGFGRSTYLS